MCRESAEIIEITGQTTAEDKKEDLNMKTEEVGPPCFPSTSNLVAHLEAPVFIPRPSGELANLTLVGNSGSVSALKEEDSEDEDHEHTTSSVTTGSVSTISTIGSEDLGVTFGPTPTMTCEIFKDITKFACTIQVLPDSGAIINLISESILKKTDFLSAKLTLRSILSKMLKGHRST